MSRGLTLLAVACLLLGGACVGRGGEVSSAERSAFPSPVPDATASAGVPTSMQATSPSPPLPSSTGVVMPSEDARPTGTAGYVTMSPSHSLTPVERSDLFWGLLAQGSEGEVQWETLAEVIDASDLVVRGRVADVRLGRTVTYPSIQFVIAKVLVEEVFKGVPETQTEGSIDIEYWLDLDATLADLKAVVPDDEATFFLFNQGRMADRAGMPEEVEDYRYTYTEVNGDQGTIREIEGRVSPIHRSQLGLFPDEYDGRPYEQLLTDIRRATPSEG